MKEKFLISNPWAMEYQNVLETLNSKESGLDDAEVKNRLKIYGTNIFHKQERINAFSIFLRQLISPLIFILIGAAIITGILGEWVEVFVIGLAVLLNTGLGFYREYHAENTLEKLSSFIKDRTRVIRNGHEQEIDSEMVVPGDIIKLSYGNRVPADARIIFSNNAKSDESILTGESVPIQKTSSVLSLTQTVADRTNMIHAGTLIVDGFVTAVVVSTGDKTEIGKIAVLVSGTSRAKTPIQKGLSKLAWIIFFVVILIVIGIFVLGVSRGESVLEMLVLSAAVSVGAVPEALPIALTVILSIGAERIARKKGITRTLIAAETLGSTSLIMTDKTGTLTEANMKLVGVYTKDEILSHDVSTNFSNGKINKDIIDLALYNVDVLIENPDAKKDEWEFRGKPFEVNIVKAAREHGISIDRFNSNEASPIIIPFNSSYKFSVSTDGSMQIVMGAPDVLLARSNLETSEYKKIEDWIIKTSEEGKRLIAITKTKSLIGSIDDVKNTEFVGILSFNDPIREEVPDVMKKISSLGVKVVMVTGDLMGTAMFVAKKIGWEVTDAEVLNGHDLREMEDEELIKILPSIKIFARVTPEDKLRIGKLYRKLNEVVAMTGDGVNDAPSLKAMDIGVALGSGSDVAKSASDLVLLDDNFKTITTAIEEGRRILVNIRKTFVYLMSNSLDAVFVVVGCLLLGINIPLTALQIIWVNLFTGSLPALAFAYDEDFDHETATKHKIKSIFTNEVNILTFGIGTISSILLFVLYYSLIKYGIDEKLVHSVFFVCFASYVLAISYSFRSLHRPLFSYPIFSNKKLNQSIIIAVFVLICTVAIPPIRNIFGLSPIPLVWLSFIFGWIVLNVLLVEFAKLLFKKI